MEWCWDVAWATMGRFCFAPEMLSPGAMGVVCPLSRDGTNGREDEAAGEGKKDTGDGDRAIPAGRPGCCGLAEVGVLIGPVGVNGWCRSAGTGTLSASANAMVMAEGLEKRASRSLARLRRITADPAVRTVGVIETGGGAGA